MHQEMPISTRPIWSDLGVIPKYPTLTGQVSVDVCIIGAGVTGLTTADLLKRTGKTVAVIERDRVSSGESSHSTALVTEVFDQLYSKLVSNFGLEGAKLAAQSMRRGIERIEKTVNDYAISCGFERVSGYRFTESRDQMALIEEDAAYASQIGVPSELIFQAPLPFSTSRAIRFEHQAQLNPLLYLSGLAERIPGQGSHIFEETRMLDIEEGEPSRVITDRGVIIADQIVVAANVPCSNRFLMHSKIAAYRTYVLSLVAKNQFEHNHLYWDVQAPYHYLRSSEFNGRKVLLIGGGDHKTGQETHTNDHFEQILDWAEERFEIEAITHRWSGQIIESVDGLPFIGRNPMSDHIFVATGFSGNGITYGTLAGMLISDLILGLENPWAELYDAARVKPVASMRSFLSENIDYPAHLIADRFSRPGIDSALRLREGQGAIVRVGAKKMAAYRDPGGELHLMSPVCPHLGCHVQWNESEKSWDCPCHGSRFSPVGELLNGPAVQDLTSEEFDENLPLTPERYERLTREPGYPVGPPILSFFSCPVLAGGKSPSKT